MPTASDEITGKGTVTLAMLPKPGLRDIQIRLLPAKAMYRHYLAGSRFNVRSLHL